MGDIVKCIKIFCAEHSENYEIFEAYSGRGMFGRECLGIVVKEENSYLKMIIELTEYLEKNGFDNLGFELEGISVDNLGMDMIVYFPRIRS